MMWPGYGWGAGWLGMAFGLVVMVAVVVGFVFLVRALWPPNPPAPYERPASGESATDIVKRRYASGEIDREEYQRLLRDLGA